MTAISEFEGVIERPISITDSNRVTDTENFHWAVRRGKRPGRIVRDTGEAVPRKIVDDRRIHAHGIACILQQVAAWGNHQQGRINRIDFHLRVRQRNHRLNQGVEIHKGNIPAAQLDILTKLSDQFCSDSNIRTLQPHNRRVRTDTDESRRNGFRRRGGGSTEDIHLAPDKGPVGRKTNRLNTGGEHTALIIQNHFTRTLNSHRLVIDRVERGPRSVDRLHVYRPHLVAVGRAVPCRNRLNGGDVVSRSVRTGPERKLGRRPVCRVGSFDGISGIGIRAPMHTIVQTGNTQNEAGCDRSTSVEQITRADVRRIGKLVGLGIFLRGLGNAGDADNVDFLVLHAVERLLRKHVPNRRYVRGENPGAIFSNRPFRLKDSKIGNIVNGRDIDECCRSSNGRVAHRIVLLNAIVARIAREGIDLVDFIARGVDGQIKVEIEGSLLNTEVTIHA